MDRRDFLKGAAFFALGAVTGKTGAAEPVGGQPTVTGGNTMPAPKKRTLGKTGFAVFPVVYGGIVAMHDDQASSNHYVNWVLERGVNYFDVAPTYGDAQKKLGISLRGHRKNVFLACKTACRSRAEAEPEFEESFRQLETDYFDVYQMHAISTSEEVEKAFAPDGVMAMMIEAQKSGRVRKLGITAHSEAAALLAMSRYDFDTVMFPLNWQMHLRNGTGTALTADAKRRGMGVLGIKALIHRGWHGKEEQHASPFAASWGKPIDLDDEALAVAALKSAFRQGADVIIPPGHFPHIVFAVEHAAEAEGEPMTAAEDEMLRREFEPVKDEPFGL